MLFDHTSSNGVGKLRDRCSKEQNLVSTTSPTISISPLIIEPYHSHQEIMKEKENHESQSVKMQIGELIESPKQSKVQVFFSPSCYCIKNGTKRRI